MPFNKINYKLKGSLGIWHIFEPHQQTTIFGYIRFIVLLFCMAYEDKQITRLATFYEVNSNMPLQRYTYVPIHVHSNSIIYKIYVVITIKNCVDTTYDLMARLRLVYSIYPKQCLRNAHVCIRYDMRLF